MMKKTCIGGNLDGSSLFSAEKVGSNEGLIREILLHVPVRSLIRFKLVSKLWSSLISDPQFTRDRTHRLKPNSVVPSGLFFFNSLANYKKFDSVSLDDSPVQQSRVRVPSFSFLFTLRSKPTVRILQSCNGLILFEMVSDLREYIVCNPTIKSYKILPQHCLFPDEIATGFTLVFDPSVSTYYKVVSFAPSKIYIYSSETGIWSTSTPPSYQRHYDLIKCDFRYRFYWNGLICCWNSGTYYKHFFEYDLKEDSFKEFNLPPNPQRGYNEQTLRYFGESQGRLHLVYVGTSFVKTFKVFERDRETLNWSVKYLVHIDTLQSYFPEICRVKRNKTTSRHVFSVLSVLVGKKEDDLALVLCIPGKIISYNVHDQTSKVLSELQSEHIHLGPELYDISRSNCCGGFVPFFCSCFDFIESLSHYDCCRGFNFIESLAAV